MKSPIMGIDFLAKQDSVGIRNLFVFFFEAQVILGDVAFISGTLQEAMQDVNLDHLDHLEATVVEVSSILGVLATSSGKAIIWDVDSNALLCQLKVNDESQMVW